MHLTPLQQSQLLNAIIALIMALIPLMAALAAWVAANTGRIGRIAARTDKLENGGTTAKIDTRLREHGILPPITDTSHPIPYTLTEQGKKVLAGSAAAPETPSANGGDGSVSGDAIAAAAVSALRNPSIVSTPGNCQKFVRETIQGLYGSLFDRFWGDNARHTMLAFLSSRYNVWQAIGRSIPCHITLQRGDILYKGDATSGEEGHTGIVINLNEVYTADGVPGPNEIGVAENSDYHIIHQNGIDGAKGIRTLEEFGNFEMVVRLSEAG